MRTLHSSKAQTRPEGGELTLSIIIVIHRTFDDLDRCLSSLRYLSGAGGDVQIVVVDNAPGDPRVEGILARHPSVVYVENSGNHGFSHGCNLGAASAVGDELLFLNPDVRDPGDGVLQLLERKIELPHIAVLGAREVDSSGQPQKSFGRFPGTSTLLNPFSALRRLLHLEGIRNPEQGSVYPVDWVSGSSLMISRSVFERIGGWSEDFWMYSEDVDLCRRVIDAGGRVAHAGDVELLHRHGGASRASASVSALTRSESLISRHVYARRHFSGLHELVYHALLFLLRFAPLIVLAVLARVWGRAPEAIRVRADVFRRLSAYYLRVAGTGNWLSEQSVNHLQHGLRTAEGNASTITHTDY